MPDSPLAIFFLVLIAAAPFGCLVYAKQKTQFTWTQFAFWIGAILLTRLLWRTTYTNSLPEEARSGAIFICNHRSGIDPFFLQVLVTRPMHWMVAKEYCEHRLFGWFLMTCGAIPVNRRGIDTASTRLAIRYAEEGELIGMFPEGRINMTEEFMLPVRPGSIMIALRAKTPVLPVYIEGAPFRGTPLSPFFMPARVRVTFGELIHLSVADERKDDDEMVRDFMNEVVREIALLAGRDDFEPQFAGRRWRPTEEEVKTHADEKRKREEKEKRGGEQ